MASSLTATIRLHDPTSGIIPVRPSARHLLDATPTGEWLLKSLQDNENNWLLNIVCRIPQVHSRHVSQALVQCGGGNDLLVTLQDTSKRKATKVPSESDQEDDDKSAAKQLNSEGDPEVPQESDNDTNDDHKATQDIPKISVAACLAWDPTGAFDSPDPLLRFGSIRVSDSPRDHLVAATQPHECCIFVVTTDSTTFASAAPTRVRLFVNDQWECTQPALIERPRNTKLHHKPTERRELSCFYAPFCTSRPAECGGYHKGSCRLVNTGQIAIPDEDTFNSAKKRHKNSLKQQRRAKIRSERQDRTEMFDAMIDVSAIQAAMEVTKELFPHDRDVRCYYAPFCLKKASECGGYHTGSCNDVNQGLIQLPPEEEFLEEKRRHKNNLKKKRRNALRAEKAAAKAEQLKLQGAPEEEIAAVTANSRTVSCYYAPFCMKKAIECGGWHKGSCSGINDGSVTLPNEATFEAAKKKYKNDQKRKRRHAAASAKKAKVEEIAKEVTTESSQELQVAVHAAAEEAVGGSETFEVPEVEEPTEEPSPKKDSGKKLRPRRTKKDKSVGVSNTVSL